MIKDLNFFRLILMFWANGEITWGLYTYYFNVFENYDTMIPLRATLALIGFTLSFFTKKEWFVKYQNLVLYFISFTLIAQMMYYSYNNYTDWKCLAGTMIPLCVMVTFLPTRKSLFWGTVVVLILSWFVPDVDGDKFFFVNISTFAVGLAIFKYFYIKRTEELYDEKLKVKEQENIIALTQFTKGISHEFNNEMTKYSLKNDLLNVKINKLLTNKNLSKEILNEISSIKDYLAYDFTKLKEITNKFSLLNNIKDKDNYRTDLTNFLIDYANEKVIFNEKEKSLLKINKVHLKIIIDNIIRNAFEANATEVMIENYHKDNYCFIEIQNNGELIENSESIFNGFYTNKDIVDHMGLGLSISKHILQQYQGDIILKNSKDTTFIIKIPIK